MPECPNACGHCCESTGQFRWCDGLHDGSFDGHPDLKALAEISVKYDDGEYAECDMLTNPPDGMRKCAIEQVFGRNAKT